MIAVLGYCNHCVGDFAHSVPHADEFEERIHGPEGILHRLDAFLAFVPPHDGRTEVVCPLEWHGNQRIFCAFLYAHPHLLGVLVVTCTAQIYECHILLRTDNVGKMKRDVMAYADILFFLEPDAADACDEEHRVISLKFRIPGFKFHEVRHYILFKFRMNMTAWPSADAEDLFYLRIVKA